MATPAGRIKVKDSWIRKTLWIVILFAVVIYAQCVCRGFDFQPFYSVYTDATNMYVFYHGADPSYFVKDLITIGHEKKIAWMMPSASLLVVYSFLLKFLMLPTAIKVVSFFLCVSSVVFIYWLARALFSFSYAFFFSGLFLMYFLSMDSFFGGMGRGFGVLCTVSFLFFIFKERLLLATASILLSLMFYRTISVSLVMTLLLVFISMKYRENFWKIVVVCCVAAIAGEVFLLHSVRSLPFFTWLQNFQTYKFYLRESLGCGGSDPLSVLKNFVFNLNEHSDLYRYLSYAFMSAAVIIMLMIKDWSNIPKAAWLMLLGATISFILIFPLHPTTASRQFVFTMPLFLVMLVGCNVYRVLGHRKVLPEVLLGILVFGFMVAHPLFNDTNSWRAYERIYAYFGAVPKDAMIAGHARSRLLRTIPFFTKRQIFYSEKMRDALLMYYSPQFIRERRLINLNAFYADSLEAVKDFIIKNKIDYLIVESKYYDEGYRNELALQMNADESQSLLYIKDRLRLRKCALLKFAEANYVLRQEVEGNVIYLLKAESIVSN
ncbi:MAG: hypothetical protein HQL17_04735 [Candidatus Omnitrophica bacterium]|nr:hypothetical protein [Candidatus Omnitrophota bacterium]